MKRTHRMKRVDTHRKKNGAKRKSIVKILIILSFAAALITTCYLLPSSYNALKDSIQQERMDYIDEVSSQLITGHLFMMDEYSASVLRYAGIIEKSGADTLAGVAERFIPEDLERIMLVSKTGKMVDLNGKDYFYTDRQLVKTLSGNTGVAQIYASLNNTEDFWLFSAPLKTLVIGENEYDTVVLAIPDRTFGAALAISLFDSQGATYIIRAGGGIVVKPNNAGAAFGGYNLFSSIEQSGAPSDRVAVLRDAVAEGGTGSVLMEIKGQEWMFGYNSIESGNSIVVAIPLTLTAAKTYDGQFDTLISMAASILLIALTAFLFTLLFFYRDRERSRIAMAAAAKSDFFSKMSHDIRTPLNAIIGLQTLIKDSSNLDAIKEYNEQSHAASTYLLGILNDVLDMTRIESGSVLLTRRPFDMNALLREVGRITRGLAADKGVLFSADIKDKFEDSYIGDAVRIQQILINLLSNAVKFTKPEGRVSFTVTRRGDDDGYDEFVFVVSDTGIGISEHYLEKVFLPFEQEQSSYTQQYSGSGLGLAIVHSLVTQMGGTVEVKSKLGEGSTFTVDLPLERGEALSRLKKQKEAAMPVSYAGMRVLLAEDNSLNQMIAANLLSKRFDFDLETASDGETAVRLFAESPPGYFDLILMDIKMPKLDGLEATKAIRALPRPDAKSIPIIALSANAYAEDIALSLETGMNEHLAKPLDMEVLSATLQKHIQKGGKL